MYRHVLPRSVPEVVSGRYDLLGTMLGHNNAPTTTGYDRLEIAPYQASNSGKSNAPYANDQPNRR
jgi:hypothetical protein